MIDIDIVGQMHLPYLFILRAKALDNYGWVSIFAGRTSSLIRIHPRQDVGIGQCCNAGHEAKGRVGCKVNEIIQLLFRDPDHDSELGLRELVGLHDLAEATRERELPVLIDPPFQRHLRDNLFDI